MTSKESARRHQDDAVSSETAEDQPDWFLQESSWNEPLWIFKPTNVLEENKPVRLRWDFDLPSGALFTDFPYAGLLESSRKIIALLRTVSLSGGLPQRARTVAGYFVYLKELLRWMDLRGFGRFEYLDATAIVQFQRYISERDGLRGTRLAPASVQKYLYLLIYMYRFHDRLDDSLAIDPFPGRSASDAARLRESDIGHLPYTPDAVAVPLIQHAIELIASGSAPILEARNLYARSMAASKCRGIGIDWCTMTANGVLAESGIELASTRRRIATVGDLAQSVDMLYAACFVTLSYLVGPRVSEILHLKAGCVEQRGEGARTLQVIVGAIFKKQPEYYGRPHEWVAPPAAVNAIRVLETLSAGHRKKMGREELWLRGTGTTGAREWEDDYAGALHLPEPQRIRLLLNRFSSWLVLPMHEGSAWRLSTHQGRKTFARFAALRDRTSLFALAQQLGHRERAVTDQGYSGSDYRLNSEIDAEILENSVGAWEQMLAAENLGGRGGAEIVSKRPRFKGSKLKEDLKTYARMLVDAGLTLGVCDWGFCVYREEQSACLGSKAGPNTERREPSTCATCKNFSVSKQHRAYWNDQIDRNHALLNEPLLPLQTLHVARRRMDEARKLVAQIDGRETSKKND